MKVLVTGAGGFVGKVLTQHLLSHGYQVRAMVRNTQVASELSGIGAEPILADLGDTDSLRGAVLGVSRIYHIAALFRQAGLPPSEFYRINVEGTKNLLDAAIEAGVRSVAHCSTVGVLGHIENPPGTESTPYNPGDHYQESKAQGEKLFLDYTRQGKIRGSVIRPAMIYGPGDTRTLKLFKSISERKFFYVGAGTSLVHFIDVRDLAESFRLLGDREDLNSEIFIIAGETSLPLKNLVSIICMLMGVAEPWLHLPVKPMQTLGSVCEVLCTPLKINPPLYRRRVDFFTKDRCFDCSKSKLILGFQPQKSLIEELTDIINSYMSTGALSRAKVRKPSAILRTLDGQIISWDEDAKTLYGWSKEQVLGSITHSLLQTRFPNQLTKINHQLQSKGLWEGKLVHTNRAGRELEVHSKWKLLGLQSSSSPLVLELNSPQDGFSNNRTGGRFATILGSIPAITDTIELASGIIPLAV